jgi:mono/diheme cytochrome c family protein
LRVTVFAATTQQRLGIAVVVVLVLAWLAYVITQLRRSPEPPGTEMELAPNRKPYYDDDALEGPRLTKYLFIALGLMAIAALGLPLYWVKEPGRQVGAEEGFQNRAVERGRILFLPTDSPEHGLHFGCGGCHGPDGGGGVAAYTITDFLGRQRSVQWKAPALNSVRSRYPRPENAETGHDELRTTIIYGRPNTPMPAWGVEGGGPMNAQQVTDLVAYIESIQVSPKDLKKPAAEIGTDGAALFDAFCARCHTKGWSFGEAEVQGGGAFGPNLTNGDTVRQFPDITSMIDFVSAGSQYEKPYGVRGVGTGRMPGFGDRGEGEAKINGMLTEAQIRAIVEYERSL